jgi:hypothetical protein
MNLIRLTYRVKSLAGDFDTSVECDFLNDNTSFMEVTDLVKKDLTIYNKFIDGVAAAYMTDYIDGSVNEDALSVATIRVNDWKLAGGYDALTTAEKTMYNNFYALIENHIQ